MFFKAPFNRGCGFRGHGDGRLVLDTAQDWLHIAFGRNQGLLSDHKLLAAASLSDRMSVGRAQVVVSHSLHYGMARKMDDVLGSVGSSSAVIVKRLWDETAMRLQLSYPDLLKVLGHDIAGIVHAIKVKGRGAHYPGYVVQSMQQMAFIR